MRITELRLVNKIKLINITQIACLADDSIYSFLSVHYIETYLFIFNIACHQWVIAINLEK